MKDGWCYLFVSSFLTRFTVCLSLPMKKLISRVDSVSCVCNQLLDTSLYLIILLAGCQLLHIMSSLIILLHNQFCRIRHEFLRNECVSKRREGSSKNLLFMRDRASLQTNNDFIKICCCHSRVSIFISLSKEFFCFGKQ